jgi:hypothetical protein
MPRSRRAGFRGPGADRTFVREGFRHHIRRFFGWVSPDRHQAMTGKGHEEQFPPARLSGRCGFRKRPFCCRWLKPWKLLGQALTTARRN